MRTTLLPMRVIDLALKRADQMGMNQTQFAVRMGVSAQSVTNWKKRADMPAELHARAADVLQCSVDELLQRKSTRAARIQHQRADVIEVPLLAAAPSMGYGGERPDHDAVIDTMRLSVPWVRLNLPAVSGLHNLALLVAYGDSMEGTFNDGDLLLVDSGVREVSIDAVFVLSLEGNLYVKRLQRRPDGSVSMISDNKLYDTIVIADGERQRFEVLGRVVWAWRGKRM